MSISAADKDLIERTRVAARLKSFRRLAREAGIGPSTARRIMTGDVKRGLNTDTREALTKWLDKQKRAGGEVVRESGATYSTSARDQLFDLIDRNDALRAVMGRVPVPLENLIGLTYSVALEAGWDQADLEQLDAIRDSVRKSADAIPINAEEHLREAEARMAIADPHGQLKRSGGESTPLPGPPAEATQRTRKNQGG